MKVNDKCTCSSRMDGKTVIVTGGNSGIGKETARELAGRGAKVILACRDAERGRAAEEEIRLTSGNQNVICMSLDLASFQSIRKFSVEFLKKEDHLDVLINNAGIINSNNYKTEDGYELSFGVNHLGHFLLTSLLMPALRRSAPSRIVNVSSYSYKMGTINFEDLYESEGRIKSYTRSKLANILFTRVLASKLEGTGVTAFSVHPGSINTEIKRNWSGFLKAMAPFLALFLKSPVDGAKTSIHCAAATDIEELSGSYFESCVSKKLARIGRNDTLANELWDKSLEMTEIEDFFSQSISSYQ